MNEELIARLQARKAACDIDGLRRLRNEPGQCEDCQELQEIIEGLGRDKTRPRATPGGVKAREGG